MILQEGAQMISRRFAREWSVVVLRTTWSTSSLINTNSPKNYCINLLHNISWSTLPRRENCTSQLNIWERPHSTLNNYRSLNCPLVQNVPEFNHPLRQLHRLKDGAEVISTCTASEWHMTYVESSENACSPTSLDQTASKSLMEALCKCTRQNLTLNSVPLRPFHRDTTRRC